jgi:hypothetical protein
MTFTSPSGPVGGLVRRSAPDTAGVLGLQGVLGPAPGHDQGFGLAAVGGELGRTEPHDPGGPHEAGRRRGHHTPGDSVSQEISRVDVGGIDHCETIRDIFHRTNPGAATGAGPQLGTNVVAGAPRNDPVRPLQVASRNLPYPGPAGGGHVLVDVGGVCMPPPGQLAGNNPEGGDDREQYGVRGDGVRPRQSDQGGERYPGSDRIARDPASRDRISGSGKSSERRLVVRPAGGHKGHIRVAQAGGQVESKAIK